MTHNQIDYKNTKTKEREADEKERSNKVNEKETQRHNKEMERTGKYQALGNIGGSIGKIIGAANDPAWYNLNPQLVKDAASISFGTPLGNASGFPTVGGENAKEQNALPGILTIQFAPGIGKSGNPSSAINIAAKNIYAWVRHANSGSRNYDSPDLMQYMFAMASAYAYYATMIRLYAAAMHTDPANWYYQRNLVRALGANPDSIFGNLAQLRAHINLYATKLRTFNVPSNFPLFHRLMWLCSNVFKDQDIKKAQLFAFVPRYLHKYNFAGVSCDAVIFMGEPGVDDTQLSSLESLSNFGNQLLDTLQRSEDIGIMSGDILKAYGESGLFTIADMGETADLNPVYSQEVLSQINTARVFGEPFSAAELSIRQHENGFIYQGHTAITNGNVGPRLFIAETGLTTWTGDITKIWNFNDNVINMYKDEVSPDDTMVASRLLVSGLCRLLRNWDYDTPNPEQYKLFIELNEYGSEILVGMYLWVSEYSPDDTMVLNKYPVKSVTMLGDADYTLWTKLVQNYPKFDWAPYVHIIAPEWNTTSFNVSALIMDSFDSANYAVISNDVLRSIHAVAIQSLLAVPLAGNKTRKK